MNSLTIIFVAACAFAIAYRFYGLFLAQKVMNLREELRLYNPDLAERPYAVIANKMDEPAAKKNLSAFKRKTKETPLEMCAELGEGVPELKARLVAHFFPGDTLLEW